MAFNHYAKLKRILADEPDGWYIRRIDEPTRALNFKGESTCYDHYYRLYHADDTPIKYGKFQKIDRLASVLAINPINLPIVNDYLQST